MSFEINSFQKTTFSSNSKKLNSDEQASKVFSVYWTFLTRKQSDKKMFKSSSDNLIFNDDDCYVIWIYEAQDEFETWFNDDTFWKHDIDMKKLKHHDSRWKNRARRIDVWIEWHEIANIVIDRSYVICKNCDFVILHFNSDRIDNNIMTRHRSLFRSQCSKKNDKLLIQKNIEKNFQTINSSDRFFMSLIMSLMHFKPDFSRKRILMRNFFNEISTIVWSNLCWMSIYRFAR